MKSKITILAAIFCLLISVTGCGDSSKEQTIVIHDYTQNKEISYDVSNEKVNTFVNVICDYLLDEESETVEIPNQALNYKEVNIFQGNQQTDESKIIAIEILKYDNEFYCNAYFSFSDCRYTVKLSDDITEQLEILE